MCCVRITISNNNWMGWATEYHRFRYSISFIPRWRKNISTGKKKTREKSILNSSIRLRLSVFFLLLLPVLHANNLNYTLCNVTNRSVAIKIVKLFISFTVFFIVAWWIRFAIQDARPFNTCAFNVPRYGNHTTHWTNHWQR